MLGHATHVFLPLTRRHWLPGGQHLESTLLVPLADEHQPAVGKAQVDVARIADLIRDEAAVVALGTSVRKLLLRPTGSLALLDSRAPAGAVIPALVAVVLVSAPPLLFGEIAAIRVFDIAALFEHPGALRATRVVRFTGRRSLEQCAGVSLAQPLRRTPLRSRAPPAAAASARRVPARDHRRNALRSHCEQGRRQARTSQPGNPYIFASQSIRIRA